MANVDKEVEATEAPKTMSGMETSDIAMKLVAAMLESKLVDIKPQLDFTTELGFIYPVV